MGTGMIKGFGFGTMTLRAALEYDNAEEVVELGEVAIEYLRRVNDVVRVYIGVEGAQDEVVEINELQLHFNEHVFVKLNSSFGVTSKAVDWAPETGIVFRF